MIVQSQQLFRSAHGLAQGLAQLPGGLHVLCDEAELVLASADAVIVLRLHSIEEPLDVLIRHAPDVLLEPPVRGVQVAVAEDDLPVVAAPRVGFHGQISDAAGVVQRDELVQGVELHAAGGESHQLAPAPRGRVVLRGQEEPRHSRGRLVDDSQFTKAAGVPDPRDGRELGVHLQPHGASGEEEVVEAGLGRDGAVDQEGVVDQDALGAALDRQQGSGRIAAHQRGLQPEVAHDLQVGGDAAVGAESAGGRRAAHEELGEVRRGGVEGAGRRHRDVPVQADAAVREGSQQGPVLLAHRHQGVLDLQVPGRAPELGGVQEAGGRDAVDRQVGRGGDAAAVLQGGQAVVDGRDRAPQAVEVCDEGIPPVRLAFAPAVAADLQS